MEPPTSDLPGGAPPSGHTLTQDPTGRRPSSFPFLAPAEGPDEVGRLADFRLLRLLGEGGMGVVFEAEDSRLGRRVAVKVMKPDAARQEEGRRRFLREARAAAAVEHDHVVPIHQVDEDRGTPFLVMPLLKGESLEARLRRRRRLPPAEAVRVAREAAEGLAAAHAAGLVHRDVKPSNLWLEQTGAGDDAFRVKVLDFGLARPVAAADGLTASGAFVGTAGYVAPEQARGDALDGRADLFSLGCVLYRLLTGRAAFAGQTLTAVLLQVQTHHPPAPRVVDPSVPADVSDLVMRLLSKDPAGRPASACEVADVLRVIELAARDESTASPPGVAPPDNAADTGSVARESTASLPRRKSRSAPMLTCSVTIALACLLLLAFGAWRVFLGLQKEATSTFRPVLAVGTPPTPTEWKGFIDVVIYDPSESHRQNVHLNDPDVMPLRPGDKFAVEAGLDRPGYCYVLWIDADGTVDPVYPWRPGHWDERPSAEEPVRRLRRPEAVDAFYPIKESAPGMETLVLLVRDTPLPRDVDLRAELGPVPPQVVPMGIVMAVEPLRQTAWFENGLVVRGEPGRAPTWVEERIDDPLWDTQLQITERLGRWFPYTRSVSFADRGK